MDRGCLAAALGVAVAVAAAPDRAAAACNPAVTPAHAQHDWMNALGQGFHAKRMNEIFLLGSHDAGTIAGAGHFRPNHSQWAWAVTQTGDLEHQLCSGYRVFDLRFRRQGDG